MTQGALWWLRYGLDPPTICAAASGLLTCGLPPGHAGDHRDVNFPVSWGDR